MSQFVAVRSSRLSVWQSVVREITGKSEALDPKVRDRIRRAVDLHVTAAQAGKRVARPVARTKGKAATLKDYQYMSQQALERALKAARKAQVEDPATAGKTGARKTSAKTTGSGRLEPPPDDQNVRTFSTDDYSLISGSGWSQCQTEFEHYYGRGGNLAKPKYVSPKRDNPDFGVLGYQLPKNARVILVGDWGTGMEDSVAMLREAVKAYTPHAILHLGDIYYSGTESECQDHVVKVLSKIFTDLNMSPIPLFTIPGNHEYYSGGVGFYKMLSSLNRNLPGSQQEASFFCLRVKDSPWQFLGMDTGWDDHTPLDAGLHYDKAPALHVAEEKWMADKLERFQGNTILLSHHQLYSAHDTINAYMHKLSANSNPFLYRTFHKYFDRIPVWFWGHEHNIAFYKEGIYGLAKGRLVGCSSYQATRAEDPYSVKYPSIPYANDKRLGISQYKSGSTEYYNHALALLEFGVLPEDRLKVTYLEFPSWGGSIGNDKPALKTLFTENIGKAYADGVDPTWSGDFELPIFGEGKASLSSSYAPGLASGAVGNGEKALYLIYVDKDSELAWTGLDGKEWKGNQKIQLGGQGLKVQSQPAAAIFENKLFVAYKGTDKYGLLKWVWYDGAKWQTTEQTKGEIRGYMGQAFSSATAPGLAVYADQLYLTYVSKDSKHVRVAAYDGREWAKEADLKDGSGKQIKSNSSRPALASFNGGANLCVVYRNGSSNSIHWSQFSVNGGWFPKGELKAVNRSGKTVNPKTDDAPWMLERDGELALLYKGQGTPRIFECLYSSTGWSGDDALDEISTISPQTKNSGAVANLGGGLITVYPSTNGGFRRANWGLIPRHRSDK